MVFCIGYSTHALPVESIRRCIGERRLKESKMVVAVGCLDLRKSLYRSRSCSCLLPNSQDLGDTHALAPGTQGPGAPCTRDTPGTPPRVIATNPCCATAGMELGDHCMILHNSHHPVPDDHRYSSLVMADPSMPLQQSHARGCPWPTHVNTRTQTATTEESTYRHVRIRR